MTGNDNDNDIISTYLDQSRPIQHFQTILGESNLSFFFFPGQILGWIIYTNVQRSDAQREALSFGILRVVP